MIFGSLFFLSFVWLIVIHGSNIVSYICNKSEVQTPNVDMIQKIAATLTFAPILSMIKIIAYFQLFNPNAKWRLLFNSILHWPIYTFIDFSPHTKQKKNHRINLKRKVEWSPIKRSFTVNISVLYVRNAHFNGKLSRRLNSRKVRQASQTLMIAQTVHSIRTDSEPALTSSPALYNKLPLTIHNRICYEQFD